MTNPSPPDIVARLRSIDDVGWQPMETVPRDGSIMAVRYHVWNVKTNPLSIQLAQWIDLYGDGGKLCMPWDYDAGVYADAWCPLAALSRTTNEGDGNACES